MIPRREVAKPNAGPRHPTRGSNEASTEVTALGAFVSVRPAPAGGPLTEPKRPFSPGGANGSSCPSRVKSIQWVRWTQYRFKTARLRRRPSDQRREAGGARLDPPGILRARRPLSRQPRKRYGIAFALGRAGPPIVGALEGALEGRLTARLVVTRYRGHVCQGAGGGRPTGKRVRPRSARRGGAGGTRRWRRGYWPGVRCKRARRGRGAR